MAPLDTLSMYNPYMMMNNIGNFGNFENDSTMTMPWLQSGFPQMTPPYMPQYAQSYNSNLSTADQKKAKADEAEKEQAEQAKKIEELKTKREEAKAELDKVKPEEKDEKVGFWSGVGHFFKGVSKSITGLVCDGDGKPSLKRALTTIGVAAAAVTLEVVTAGAATPLLVGAGVAMAGFQTAKGAAALANAKTKEEKIHAIEDMGEGTGGLALSFVGGRVARNTKITKAGALADELAPGASKLGTTAEKAVTAIRNSKGNQKKIDAALEDLAILSKNKGKALEGEKYKSFREIVAPKASESVKPEFINATSKNEIVTSTNEFKQSLLTATGKIKKGQEENLKEIEALITELTSPTSKSSTIKAITKAQKIISEANTKGRHNELELLLAKANKDLKKLDLIANTKTRIAKPFVKAYSNISSKEGWSTGLTAIKERPNSMLLVTAGPNFISSAIKDVELDNKEKELAIKINEKAIALSEAQKELKKEHKEQLDSAIKEAQIYKIKVDTTKIKIDDIEAMDKEFDHLKKQIKEAQSKE